MEEENFTEKIILNIRMGNPILSDSWLETYTSIMYGLPSPHNSESSSVAIKKKTRTDVVANYL